MLGLKSAGSSRQCACVDPALEDHALVGAQRERVRHDHAAATDLQLRAVDLVPQVTLRGRARLHAHHAWQLQRRNVDQLLVRFAGLETERSHEYRSALMTVAGFVDEWLHGRSEAKVAGRAANG